MTPSPRRLAALALALLLGACQIAPPLDGARPGAQPREGAPDNRPSISGDDPGGFRGLTAADVMAKLGTPSYRRHESPAEVWQYFGPGCVLDLFLYDDNGAQRVTHAELRSRNLTPPAEAACLSRLLEGKRGDANS